MIRAVILGTLTSPITILMLLLLVLFSIMELGIRAFITIVTLQKYDMFNYEIKDKHGLTHYDSVTLVSFDCFDVYLTFIRRIISGKA
jgi:hypothetical protein